MLYIKIDKNNIDQFVENNIVLVCKLRTSRIKSKQLAVIELLSLLNYCNPIFVVNGPLGDVKGCICVSVSKQKHSSEITLELLSHVGYTNCFYQVDFDGDLEAKKEETVSDLKSINPYVWKGRRFTVFKLYEDSTERFREQAPDKRIFKLLCEDGIVRNIKGYRGDGTEMGRRALPVEDCRLLANIVIRNHTKNFLDPFCGGGGIIYQARLRDCVDRLFSVDIAPELAPGLEDYGAIHFVGNAADFSPEESIDALATEVPFSKAAQEGIYEGLKKLSRYLSDECIVAIMYSVHQKDDIEDCLFRFGYNMCLSIPVNRKGTDVRVAICYRSQYENEKMKTLWERLRFIS